MCTCLTPSIPCSMHTVFISRVERPPASSSSSQRPTSSRRARSDASMTPTKMRTMRTRRATVTSVNHSFKFTLALVLQPMLTVTQSSTNLMVVPGLLPPQPLLRLLHQTPLPRSKMAQSSSAAVASGLSAQPLDQSGPSNSATDGATLITSNRWRNNNYQQPMEKQ